MELLRRVGVADEQALAELFQRYQSRVFNLAYRYLSSRSEADEVTQDTFLRVWQHARDFRGTSQVWTWIYRITTNLCLTRRAKRRVALESLDESVAASPGLQPDVALRRREQEVIVRRALDSLPADQRLAIVLSRYESLSYEEIAQVLNRSLPAVATLIFRAKEGLRTKLRPYLKQGKISP